MPVSSIKRNTVLIIGYLAGVLGRFFFAFLSGVIFFASYAPTGMGTVVYSLAYNGSYLAAEAVITLVILAFPPISGALKHDKTDGDRMPEPKRPEHYHSRTVFSI